MKKSIYFWSPHLTKVGTVKSTLNSAISFSQFSKKQYDIKIINVFGEWNDYKKTLEYHDIKKIDLTFNYYNLLPKYGFVPSRISYLIIIFTSIFPLLRLLKKEQPDYFIVHLLTSLPLLLFKIFKFKSKLVLRISGNPKLNFLRKFFWELLNKKLFKITCPTKELSTKLSQNKIFSTEKIFHLPDPVIDIKEFKLKQNSKPLSYKLNDNNFFLCVGRFTKQKNYDYLINEFSKFAKISNKFKLVIIGDGEQKKRIEKLIKIKNLDEKVFLPGYEDNFYYYMKRAAAFILPSLWEELGLAIVQAAMSNTVIISSDCPHGPREFLENGKSGILFSNNKEDELSKSLKLFLENENNFRKKRIIAKKNCLNYTKFRHYKVFNQLLNL